MHHPVVSLGAGQWSDPMVQFSKSMIYCMCSLEVSPGVCKQLLHGHFPEILPLSVSFVLYSSLASVQSFQPEIRGFSYHSLPHNSHNSPTSGAKQQEDRERKNSTRFIHFLGSTAPLIAEKIFHSTEFQVFVGPAAAATTTTATNVELPGDWDVIEWNLKKIKRKVGDSSHSL